MEKEDVMKNALRAILVTLSTVSTAFAAGGANSESFGILTWMFLGFGALIIVFQLVPVFILFVSMLKGVIMAAKEPAIAEGEKTDSK